MNRIAIALIALATASAASAQIKCPAERDTLPRIDYTAHILTPDAPTTPRINGPRVYGARPEAPFIYRVPCTGVRPMTFEAEGLPEGLSIDATTGIITGAAETPGEYPVKLKAINNLGTDSRTLTIKIGDQVALTPPLGWSSWNCWGLSIDDALVRETMQAMLDYDLADYGWTYINIDDGWQGVRGGELNAIQPNPHKFPDMKALADEIHSHGLKLGIYSAPWVGSYAGFTGSYADNPEGIYDWVKPDSAKYQLEWPARWYNFRNSPYSFVDNDVAQWNIWGIDYLKYDWTPNQTYYVREMHDAIRAHKRDILFGMSNAAPFGDATYWARYPNCYRTTGDIRDTWRNMSRIGFQQQDKWIPFNVPGHWADADMMVVGVVGWDGELHHSRLTPDEQYTHVSLWAILASPMFLGCDMTQLDDFTLSLLRNHEILDVHQDELGYQAVPITRGDSTVTYAKPLYDGSMAVGLFNLASEPTEITLSPADFGIRDRQKIRDLWRQTDIWENEAKEKITLPVNPHGAVMLRIYPGNNHGPEPHGHVY